MVASGRNASSLRSSPSLRSGDITRAIHTARFTRPNSAFGGTSYSPNTLYEIPNPAFGNRNTKEIQSISFMEVKK